MISIHAFYIRKFKVNIETRIRNLVSPDGTAVLRLISLILLYDFYHLGDDLKSGKVPATGR